MITMPRTSLEQFFEELDNWRGELRKHKDYAHLAAVSFYVGRGVWNITCNGILSIDKATRIQRRAKAFFPECEVVVNHFMYYTVKIYF